MTARIQLSRRKGWRMPENSVSVARPGRWGNPHRVGDGFDQCPTAKDAVAKFRQGFADIAKYGFTDSPIGRMSRDMHELCGKNLACWCPLDQACHADVLLELANKELRP